jgi:hypothetical protein
VSRRDVERRRLRAARALQHAARVFSDAADEYESNGRARSLAVLELLEHELKEAALGHAKAMGWRPPAADEIPRPLHCGETMATEVTASMVSWVCMKCGMRRRRSA